MAVVEASRDVREQLRGRAAKIWNVPVEDTRWEQGRVVPVNAAEDRQPLTVAELASKLAKTGGPIIGRASVNPPMAGPDGLPRPELFRDDQLHLKPAGYAIWTKVLAPHLHP